MLKQSMLQFQQSLSFDFGSNTSGSSTLHSFTIFNLAQKQTTIIVDKFNWTMKIMPSLTIIKFDAFVVALFKSMFQLHRLQLYDNQTMLIMRSDFLYSGRLRSGSFCNGGRYPGNGIEQTASLRGIAWLEGKWKGWPKLRAFFQKSKQSSYSSSMENPKLRTLVN